MVVFAAFTVLQSKFAPPPKKLVAPVSTSVPRDSGAAAAMGDTGSAPATSLGATAATGVAAATPAVAARTYVLETPLYKATFRNIGARLQSFELKHFAAAHGTSNYAEHPNLRPR